jgi:ribosomal protein S18 acetylase RimI-like enzyme
MNKSSERAQVIEVSPERLDEAAEVLTLSFLDYPLTQYMFEGHGTRYAEQLHASYRLDCMWIIELGWPFLGALNGEKLVAVALVAGLDPVPPDHPLNETEQALNKSFGTQTASRLKGYWEMKLQHKPLHPHLYLEAIGVLPEHRGEGHAGRLLRAVHRISEASSVSIGVALDTQVPANLALYRHFGYEVSAEDWMGPVRTWFMFRPNQVGEGQ